MPAFNLVLGKAPDQEEPITLVQIAEGEFTGLLLEITHIDIDDENVLSFKYNIYNDGREFDRGRLDEAVS